MNSRTDKLVMFGLGVLWILIAAVPFYFLGYYNAAAWCTGFGAFICALPFIFSKQKPVLVFLPYKKWVPWASAACFVAAISLSVLSVPVWVDFINGVLSIAAVFFLIGSIALKEKVE